MLKQLIPVTLCVFQIFGELYRSSPQEEEWRSFPGHLIFLILYLRRRQAYWSHWHSSDQLRWYKHTTRAAQFTTKLSCCKSISFYSSCFSSFSSGAGQWGVSGPDSSSSCWSASDRHHHVHQGYECSLCHQPVFIQQHYCPCATAWIRYINIPLHQKLFCRSYILINCKLEKNLDHFHFEKLFIEHVFSSLISYRSYGTGGCPDG